MGGSRAGEREEVLRGERSQVRDRKEILLALPVFSVVHWFQCTAKFMSTVFLLHVIYTKVNTVYVYIYSSQFRKLLLL